MNNSSLKANTRKKTSINTLKKLKDSNSLSVGITAYDYPSAVFANEANVDWILVGDSGGMTTLGYPSTIPVTMEEMLQFSKSVTRGNKHTFVVGDMPFMSYQVSNRTAVKNAGKFISTGGCDAVKLEGGRRMATRIRAIVDAGIAVMGHLGLTPQSLSQMGGYRVQGNTLDSFVELIEDAKAVEKAGACLLLLEALPNEVAGLIRSSLSIPVYGIGAGAKLDGQLIILHDILGTFVGDIKPKFVKVFAELGKETINAISSYGREVRSREFPSGEHFYQIDNNALEEIKRYYDLKTKSRVKNTPSLKKIKEISSEH